MLIYPTTKEIFPIGSVIESNAPPSNKWERCAGQVVLQSDYPTLYNMMENPHPMRWNNIETFGMLLDNMPYTEAYVTNGTIHILLGYGGDITYSTDFVSWTTINPISANWYCGAWNGTTFCILGYNSTIAAISSDGINWTQKTLPISKQWDGVVWDGTYFIAKAWNYNSVIRSTDGESWETKTGITSATSGYVGYNGISSDGAGKVLVSHHGGELGLTDDHADSWENTIVMNGNYYSKYLNSKFLVPYSNGILGVSSDGSNWNYVQTRQSDEPYIYRSIREGVNYHWNYSNGMYLGVPGRDSSGISYYIYSYDLINFYPIHKPTEGRQNVYISVWDSINDRWLLFGIASNNYGYIDILTEFAYDENTYFQFPLVSELKQDNGKQWYIRVR